jgi:hypothetical protein
MNNRKKELQWFSFHLKMEKPPMENLPIPTGENIDKDANVVIAVGCVGCMVATVIFCMVGIYYLGLHAKDIAASLGQFAGEFARAFHSIAGH